MNNPPMLLQLPPTFSMVAGAVNMPVDMILIFPAKEKIGTEQVILLWNTQVSPLFANVVGCVPVLLFTDHQLVSTEASPPVVTEYHTVPPIYIVLIDVEVPQA